MNHPFLEQNSTCRFVPPADLPFSEVDYSDFNFLQHLNLPWFPVELDGFNYLKMYDEARAVKSRFVEHRALGTEYGYGKGWKSLCLHGLSEHRTENWERYSDVAVLGDEALVPYDFTQASEYCPEITAFLKCAFPFESYQRVRLMLLEPGGYILPHCDRGQGLITSITLALNNPKGCDFIMKSCGVVPLKQGGDACIIDVSREHAVFNNSGEDRYHLIIHGNPGRFSQQWRDIVTKSYATWRSSFS